MSSTSRESTVDADGAGGERRCCYTVAVKTSDIFAAGTDARVHVELVGGDSDEGEMRTTGALLLKRSVNHKNKFERGRTDVFFFPGQRHLGPLRRLRVWHDNRGPGPGWHLDCIEVHDSADDLAYYFPCGRWLARDEDDGRVDRMLNCTGRRAKRPTITR